MSSLSPLVKEVGFGLIFERFILFSLSLFSEKVGLGIFEISEIKDLDPESSAGPEDLCRLFSGILNL